ncbi:Cell wall-associated protease [bacterium HR11]|nr:Cell wall-associated protease [bacterium HR11]
MKRGKRLHWLWLLPGLLLLTPLMLGLQPRPSAGDPKADRDSLFERVRIGKGRHLPPEFGYLFRANKKAERPYVPGEVLVRFKKGVSAAQAQALHRQLGTTVLLESRMVPGLQWVRLPVNLSVKRAIELFEKSGLVQYAEPNYIVHVLQAAYPNDPFVQIRDTATHPFPGYYSQCDPESPDTDGKSWFTYSWDLQMATACTYVDPFLCPSGFGCGGNNASRPDISVLPCTDPKKCVTVESQGAWTHVPQTTTQDVLVMVIDTGVDYTHVDVAANMWVNPGEVPANGLDDDNDGIVDDVHGIRTIGAGGGGPGCGSANFGDPMDDFGHGTHVASTIAARANNVAGLVGMGGLQNRVKIIGCKFLDSSGTGTTADAIKCFEYAYYLKVQRGFNLVATSNSWGGGGFSWALYDAIAANRDAGILAVFAAGNDASDNDTTDNFPSNYDLDNIIAVGSMNQHDCASSFSNWGGRSVDIFAPGSLILGACPWPLIGMCSGDPNAQYVFASGTSMATPHVTGLAALLKAVQPSLQWWQIRNIILTTGVASTMTDADCSALGNDDVDLATIGDPTFQSYTGDGTPAGKKSVTDKRINALRAAQVAAAGSGPGDYDLRARIWPYGMGPFSGFVGQPFVMKVINVNGWNVGAPGSVTADVQKVTVIETPVLTEDFSGGIPASWTIVNGGTCTATWTDTNPCSRSIGPPFSGTFAIADSDCAGSGCGVMDEQLITPSMDLSACTGPGKNVWLRFSNQYNNLGDVADVDVSIDGGTTWTTVLHMISDDGYPTPNTKAVDLTAIAAGQPNVKVRFHYYNANWAWWWAIDNVEVVCQQVTSPTLCTTLTLVDDGTPPDQVAGDGIFVGSFVPGNTGNPACDGTPAGTYLIDLKVNATTIETLTVDASSAPPVGILEIVPDPLEFAFVAVGGSKTLPVHIRNIGTAPFAVTTVGPSPDPQFAVSCPPTPFTVNAGAEVLCQVTFTPAAGGFQSAGIPVTTDTAGSGSINAQGTGVGPYPDIHMPTTTLDFGTVVWGHTQGQGLTVKNLGASDLIISGVDNSLAPSVTVTTTLPLTIAPSTSSLLNFSWNSSSGCIDSRVGIVSNDPDESNVQVRVLARTSIADVASGVDYYVQRLISNQITGGCGTEASVYGADLNGDGDMTDLVYCPLADINRAQMAIFISRAVLGTDPPAVGSGPGGSWDCTDGLPNQFTDVPDGVFYCRHVHWMWANNIAGGCTATTYCPLDPVNRAQMAIFISRAVLGTDPPAVGSGPGGSWDCTDGLPNQFTDVPDGVFYCPHVHWMWANNITGGCTATTYCPLAPVNRAQMAIFLQRAFALQCR